MPFHSQTNVAVSAGDAAVLIRAMNRQRTETATRPSRPLVPESKAANLDHRVLSFVRRKTSGQDKPTTTGSSTFPSRRKPSNQEKPATTASSVLSSSRRVSVNGKETATVGSDAALSRRRKLFNEEKPAKTASSLLSSGRRVTVNGKKTATVESKVSFTRRRKPGSAVRAAERDQVESGDRRVRRSRACDDSPEPRSNRTARATGSRTRSNSPDRTPKPTNPLAAVAAWFTDLTPHTQKTLAIAACAVALVAFFYGPTADLYAAARDHSQLVAKVEATNAIADDLKAEVDRLQTEEGVMDEARIRGYANPGEVAGDASELLGIEDTVTVPELSKPIETEEPPLYIQALDVIMGYEEHV